MKSFVTAAALSFLAATAVQAAGNVAPGGVELRNANVTSPKERIEINQDVKTLTIGAPKEVSISVLPPRDRAEAGYKADAALTVSSFPGQPGAAVSAR